MKKSLIISDGLMYVALLAVIFFLPFSLALIQIFLGIMILAWAVKLSLSGRTSDCRPQGFNFFASGIGWSLIAIALLIVLTVPFSQFPALSVKKFFSRFLQQILLMYLVTQIVHSRKRLYGVLVMFLVTLFFVIADAFIQLTSGKSFVHHTLMVYGRLQGPMGHPNDFGTLLVTVLPVVLVLIVTVKSWGSLLTDFLKVHGQWISWGLLALTVGLFLALLLSLGLTSSRGAWFALAGSMIFLGVYLRKYKFVLLTILILVAFFWIFSIRCLNMRPDVYNGQMMHGSTSNKLELLFNPTSREQYWETAEIIIKHYPWFGCGYSAYVQTLKDFHIGHQEYPHNSLLHIWVELGIVGLILYGWFFTALFLEIKKTLRLISAQRDLFLIACGLVAGILGWFFHSLMDTAWGSLQLSILWWLFIGILLSLRFCLPNHKGEETCPSP